MMQNILVILKSGNLMENQLHCQPLSLICCRSYLVGLAIGEHTWPEDGRHILAVTNGGPGRLS